jgi:hypothetical protein
MMELLFTFAALLAADPEATTAAPRVEAWAGHQVLKGKRKIPIYGEKETHTENYLIAEIHRSKRRIDIRQKLCRTEVRPIKGVTGSMKPTTIARLPKSHLVLEEGPDGALTAEPWTTGWEAEDIDADGFPGATIQISGTKCSGDVYVSNHSVTRLVSGLATDDGVTGEISVRVKQKILGASGLCLKLIAGDSEETQTGWFAFRRVPIGSNCRNLADHPWPVKAGPPSPAAQ